MEKAMTPLFGIGYRRPYREALLARDLPEDFVLEIMGSHFFSNPLDLAPLVERFPVVLHEVMGSLGTEPPGTFDDAWLERMKKVVQIAKPLFVTEHLAFTRSASGADLGHLCPLWMTHASKDALVVRVKKLQDALGVRVLLENIAWPFVIPNADYDEASFLRAICEETGAGILLDVSNVIANAKNFGFDAQKWLDSFPVGHVEQVHLAGSQLHRGFWVDSHDSRVDASSYLLLDHLAKTKVPRAVIIERDGAYPPLEELLLEVARARSICSPSENDSRHNLSNQEVRMP